MRAGEIRKLYTFKIDRVTRSGVADTYKFVAELRAAGCELHIPGDNLDCIVFGLSLGARVQRAAINDNIAAARERIETEGPRWGRPRRTTWNQEAEVLERRAGGESVRAISTALKIPRATSAAAGPFQSRLTSRPCRR